jgi:hypothetical protein
MPGFEQVEASLPSTYFYIKPQQLTLLLYTTAQK